MTLSALPIYSNQDEESIMRISIFVGLALACGCATSVPAAVSHDTQDNWRGIKGTARVQTLVQGGNAWVGTLVLEPEAEVPLHSDHGRVHRCDRRWRDSVDQRRAAYSRTRLGCFHAGGCKSSLSQRRSPNQGSSIICRSTFSYQV